MEVLIREATQKDHEEIWGIFSSVIESGDTYVFDPNTPRKDLEKHWFGTNTATFALIAQGKILGTYILKPNHLDLGSHIANAGYMVSPKAQGAGYGKLLCEHSINQARKRGYLGIQFNIVVSTNISAIKLWQKYGFKIIGTTPNGFRHKKLGFVDTHIMYKSLESQ